MSMPFVIVYARYEYAENRFLMKIIRKSLGMGKFYIISLFWKFVYWVNYDYDLREQLQAYSGGDQEIWVQM